MNWRPNSDPEIARSRATMLNLARTFFDDRQILEVCTPALSAHATMDPNIESIVATQSGYQSYLHTSPEYFMKRLLAAGYPDIYQICRVFRSGENGRRHLSEFTMIEWYRLNFELKRIMKETADFITTLLTHNKLAQEPIQVSYTEAFQNALALDPLHADIDSIARALDADAYLRERIGDDRDAWLDLAMSTQVATTFTTDRLTLVYHYPIGQASLAQVCPLNEELSDRFEIFYGPLELANGFVELTDADVQEKRFRRDQKERKTRGIAIHSIDENLIDALHAGLPTSAGVAVGLERLLMIDNDLDDIQATTTFTPGS